MLMPDYQINELRLLFSAREVLCGLPSVTIQIDRVRTAFRRGESAIGLH
jgi:hypothetical protein